MLIAGSVSFRRRYMRRAMICEAPLGVIGIWDTQTTPPPPNETSYVGLSPTGLVYPFPIYMYA